MELICFVLFLISLIFCIQSTQPLFYALLFGYIVFFIYGLLKGYSIRELFKFSWNGVTSAHGVLCNFFLIGILTAAWRASGTIAYLVVKASSLCTPSILLLITFLLCCIVSFFTGSAFGSAATIGVICMTISDSMGFSPIFSGGAILSGIYFGDRCSPLSTSALLICKLTQTDSYTNLQRMLQTSFIPFLGTCLIYILLGRQTFSSAITTNETVPLLTSQYQLSIIVLLPAIFVALFSLLKIPIKYTMLFSITTALFLTVFVQHLSLNALPFLCIFGYHPSCAALASIMQGGGILSMTNAFLIVGLSSSYAGIFQGTHFLTRIQQILFSISVNTAPIFAILFTAILTSLLSCNQTLAILLTQQLCAPISKDKTTFATQLENSAVILPALVPWSTAASVPIFSIGAPTECLFAACYLYFLPVYYFGITILKYKKEHINNKVISTISIKTSN